MCELLAYGHIDLLTGEAVLEGDVVKLHTWSCVVVTVVQPGSPDWDDYGGISLKCLEGGPIRLERVNEDLILVSRKASR